MVCDYGCWFNLSLNLAKMSKNCHLVLSYLITAKQWLQLNLDRLKLTD